MKRHEVKIVKNNLTGNWENNYFKRNSVAYQVSAVSCLTQIVSFSKPKVTPFELYIIVFILYMWCSVCIRFTKHRFDKQNARIHQVSMTVIFRLTNWMSRLSSCQVGHFQYVLQRSNVWVKLMMSHVYCLCGVTNQYPRYWKNNNNNIVQPRLYGTYIHWTLSLYLTWRHL